MEFNTYNEPVTFHGFSETVDFKEPLQILQNSAMPSIPHLLLAVCKNTFLSCDISNTDDTPKHLFFLCREYSGRNDHKTWFRKLACLIPNGALCDQCSGRGFHIGYIRRAFSWLWQMRHDRLSLQSKLHVIDCLQKAYNAIDSIECAKALKSLTVLCDCHFVDHVVVQHFKGKGIKTVTMQHGFYSRLNMDPFQYSPADWMLGYGESVLDESRALGIPEDKIICVGMPQIATGQLEPVARLEDGCPRVIGIEMSGDSSIEQDIAMYEAVTELAEDEGLNIAIKFHPGFPPQSYKKHFNSDRIVKMAVDEETAEQFIRGVGWCVCGGSTILIQNLLLMRPTIVFVMDEASNPYNRIDWCLVHDKEGLLKKAAYYRNDAKLLEAKMIETRTYFTLTENVLDNYNTFYEGL